MKKLTLRLPTPRNRIRTLKRRPLSLTQFTYITTAPFTGVKYCPSPENCRGNSATGNASRTLSSDQRNSPRVSCSQPNLLQHAPYCGRRVIEASACHVRASFGTRRFSTNGSTVPSLSSPVAIVGAGPAGLTLSALLSQYGVPSVLLEKASALPTHPQAHFINLRSMEILRHAFGGLDVDVLDRCPPREEWRDFIVCSSALGRELARVDNFSGGEKGETKRRELSPTSVAHLSQNVLLPVLLEEAQQTAKELSPSSQIIFDAEVTGLRRARDSSQEQAPRTKIDLLVKRARSSTASQTCTNPTTGSRGESILGQNASEIPGVVTCDYAVAADGAGSVVRAAAGIGLSGKTGLGYLVNVHFRCKELGSLLRDRGRRPGMLYFVYNEEVICVLVAHNVQRGEWACQVPFFPPHQKSEDFTPERVLALVRHALGPGGDYLNMEICSVRPWTMNALIADSYSTHYATGDAGGFAARDGQTGGAENTGAVFLLGDAAHQFPPAGGFGLNTGMQDAHNLAWKLAAVHHGFAAPDLLQSYEQERRPVAMRNAALSVRNLKRSFRVMERLGVDPNLGASNVIIDQLVQSPLALNFSNGVSGMVSSILRPQERSENILRLGRRQLANLRRPGHPYGDWRVRSLHQLLAEGGGLPLLFPEHDVGFAYSHGAFLPSQCVDKGASSAAEDRENGRVKPTGTLSASDEARGGDSSPHLRIKVGRRMPHLVLRSPATARFDNASGGASERSGKSGTRGGKSRLRPSPLPLLLSTVDLPDQIRRVFLQSIHTRRLDTGNEAARIGLTSVLIVPASDADGESAQKDRGGSQTSGVPISASERWMTAAVSAQKAAPGRRGRLAGGPSCSSSPPPLIVLTVVPPNSGLVSDVRGGAFDRKQVFDIAQPDMTERRELEVGEGGKIAGQHHWTLGQALTLIQHLEPYLGDACLAQTATRAHSTGTDHSVTSTDGNPRSSDVATQGPTGSSACRHEFVPSRRGKWASSDVLSMVAVDDRGESLGKLFAAEGLEAVLLRPDGHVAWIACRRNSNGHGDLAGDLRRALDAICGGSM